MSIHWGCLTEAIPIRIYKYVLVQKNTHTVITLSGNMHYIVHLYINLSCSVSDPISHYVGFPNLLTKFNQCKPLRILILYATMYVNLLTSFITVHNCTLNWPGF